MDLSFNDLLIIQDGLNKVYVETRGSLLFMSSAIGADPEATPRLKRKLDEIEYLQDRVAQAIDNGGR